MSPGGSELKEGREQIAPSYLEQREPLLSTKLYMLIPLPTFNRITRLSSKEHMPLNGCPPQGSIGSPDCLREAPAAPAYPEFQSPLLAIGQHYLGHPIPARHLPPII